MNKYFTIILFSIIFCYSNALFGQPTKSIDFNNFSSSTQNDFTNHFTGTGFYQIPDSGITGGCLRTPATVSWGSDNAVFCSRIKAMQGSVLQVSFSFLYDTTTLNNIYSDRTVSLWFTPSADPNHSFILECNPNGLRVTTYNSSRTGPGYNLIHNHWYKVSLGFPFTYGSLGSLVGLDDLGVTGDTNIGGEQFYFNETDMIIGYDPSIEISISGSSYGGAKYLDNFECWGDTTNSICLSTGIDDIIDQPVDVRITNSIISIRSLNSPFSADVYNLRGQLIFSTVHSTYFEKDFKDLAKGIYVLKVCSMDAVKTYKFVATN